MISVMVFYCFHSWAGLGALGGGPGESKDFEYCKSSSTRYSYKIEELEHLEYPASPHAPLRFSVCAALGTVLLFSCMGCS